MIGILHGYLLDGSGSNLWTRNICEALARSGENVSLFCQENHPDRYPFISTARRYDDRGAAELFYSGQSPHAGQVELHKPQLGDMLPVFVEDKYEEFAASIPMNELNDAQIESYLQLNVNVVRRVVDERKIKLLIANHAVLMPTVAERVSDALGIPFVIIPHGSAIEYILKKDARLKKLAVPAFEKAKQIFCVSTEMRDRIINFFPDIKDLHAKTQLLNVGVDTTKFDLVAKKDIKPSLERLETLVRKLAADKSSTKVTDADAMAKLKKLSWERNPPLLFVGRLIAAKGLQNLVLALPLLLKKVPHLQLVIAGHGPLRGPMETLCHALQKGDEEQVRNLVHRSSSSEDDGIAPYFLQSELFLEKLRRNDELNSYFAVGKKLWREQTVTFTGYLGHAELACLYPLCGVAVFPSLVPEAGPMVFLEALASGCLPAGTNQAGIKTKIDKMAETLSPELCEKCRLHPDKLIDDIILNIPHLLQRAPHCRESLRQIAVAHFEWTKIAADLRSRLTRH